MLAAVAVGYEVGMRSGMYWNRDHARVYTSGLWGAIGAVAAAGRILGLKEDVLLQALNCADYHGPVGFIARGVATPCMAKDGVGWGAHTAMMSILLAQAGFTSPLLDFDAALAEELGSRWRMADLYFKPLPSATSAVLSSTPSPRRPRSAANTPRIRTRPSTTSPIPSLSPCWTARSAGPRSCRRASSTRMSWSLPT